MNVENFPVDTIYLYSILASLIYPSPYKILPVILLRTSRTRPKMTNNFENGKHTHTYITYTTANTAKYCENKRATICFGQFWGVSIHRSSTVRLTFP